VRPVSYMESSNRARVRRVDGVRCVWPHEHTDRVLSACVHERGDRATRDVVGSSPGERNPTCARSVTGGEKSNFPRNQGFAVC